MCNSFWEQLRKNLFHERIRNNEYIKLLSHYYFFTSEMKTKICKR